MNTATPTTPVTLDAGTVVARYLAAWNERDATRRRALIAQTLTEDASYLDPLMRSEGHAAIDAMIQAVQEQFAGHHFQARNQVDSHNSQVRFSWDLAPEGGAGIVGGTDFATLAADGRLQAVVGFLDYVPTHN